MIRWTSLLVRSPNWSLNEAKMVFRFGSRPATRVTKSVAAVDLSCCAMCNSRKIINHKSNESLERNPTNILAAFNLKGGHLNFSAASAVRAARAKLCGSEARRRQFRSGDS